MPRALEPLHTQALRVLSVNPAQHPRGQAFLSAASGLVCQQGRAYVVADDEHHLAVFHDVSSPGRLHRVFEGDLPEGKKARKRIKPDLECLLWWPAQPSGLTPGLTSLASLTSLSSLLALGSGSKPQRDRAVLMPLGANGELGHDISQTVSHVQHLDLSPLYAPLRARFGRINIEGAFVQGDELVLLNRSAADGAPNATLHYRVSALQALIAGGRAELVPQRIHEHTLGQLQGVPLGFTDGAALPDGGWVFTAVAEDSDNAVADGDFFGAVVGIVDAQGQPVAMRRLAQPAKVEGIAVQRQGRHLSLCMVTDADDPTVPSSLLLARW
jgi:hypothetical protein